MGMAQNFYSYKFYVEQYIPFFFFFFLYGYNNNNNNKDNL
jgi:hypothetical protein